MVWGLVGWLVVAIPFLGGGWIPSVLTSQQDRLHIMCCVVSDQLLVYVNTRQYVACEVVCVQSGLQYLCSVVWIPRASGLLIAG